MAAFAEMAAPAPEHRNLDVFVGEWDAEVKMWMGPGEPHVSHGVMVNAWVLGNRWVEQKYEGTGYDFKGQGLFGFNKTTGKYEGLWIDTCSTFMQTDTGDYDATSKTFTMTSRMLCPQSKEEMAKRSVIKVHSPDKHSMEMYFQAEGQPETKCMEITYTRRK